MNGAVVLKVLLRETHQTGEIFDFMKRLELPLIKRYQIIIRQKNVQDDGSSRDKFLFLIRTLSIKIIFDYDNTTYIMNRGIFLVGLLLDFQHCHCLKYNFTGNYETVSRNFIL